MRNTRDVLNIKNRRLEEYYRRESEILSEKGVKSYSIGSQSLSRWDTSLKEIQDAIKSLEREVSDLEILVNGKKPIKSVAVVIRDW